SRAAKRRQVRDVHQARERRRPGHGGREGRQVPEPGSLMGRGRQARRPAFGRRALGWAGERWPALAFLAALIAVWELAARAFGVPKYLLPLPSQIAAALADDAGPVFAEHTPWTL